ncbi:hypothetical protein BSLA_02r4366 [Burkholderia stabilis]|nr:hypothetical protein BSLA_02r4366 [Burkholderia stabilis]
MRCPSHRAGATLPALPCTAMHAMHTALRDACRMAASYPSFAWSPAGARQSAPA